MAFIIALVISVAFFIGSWMWIMPSLQEKQLGALRQRASMAGFRVKFITFDTYQKLIGKQTQRQQVQPVSQIVRYSKTWTNESKVKQLDCHYQLVLSDSRELLALNLNQQQIPESRWPIHEALISSVLALAALMDGLLAVGFQRIDSHCDLSLYWLEQGKIEKVSFTDPLFDNLLAQVKALP